MPWFYLFFALSGILVLAGCGGGETRTNYPQPPMYPAVHNLIVDRSHMAQRIVEFQTPDTPEAVHKFFQDQLSQDGWKVVSLSADHSSYYYRGPNYNYGLGVYTRVMSNGEILVQVRFGFSGPGVAFPDKYPFPPGYN
jgi:hypothetical protein